MNLKLLDVLTALSKNKGVNITLKNSEDVALITFNAAGYASVESDLTLRKVDRITIDSETSITILLNDESVEEPQPTPEPDVDPTNDTTDPSNP